MTNKTAPIVALNPPFDYRWNYSGKFNTPTEKGYILCLPQAGVTDSSVGPQPGRINFLFNPAQVGISHQMNANVSGGQAALPDLSPDMGTILGAYGSMSFDLQFDRTFEIHYGKSTTGVYDDVSAFYKMLGVLDSTGNPFNPMYMVQVQVFFGPVVNVEGYISDFSVNYTAWTPDLVPMRASVSVGLSLMKLADPASAFDGTYASIVGANGNPQSWGQESTPAVGGTP